MSGATVPLPSHRTYVPPVRLAMSWRFSSTRWDTTGWPLQSRCGTSSPRESRSGTGAPPGVPTPIVNTRTCAVSRRPMARSSLPSTSSPSESSTTVVYGASPRSCAAVLASNPASASKFVERSGMSLLAAASRNVRNVEWSRVGGSWRNPVPPKITRPTRSSANARAIVEAACLAAPSREGATSVAPIDRDTSSANTMSPLVRCRARAFTPNCGRASATTQSAMPASAIPSASRRRRGRGIPAGSTLAASAPKRPSAASRARPARASRRARGMSTIRPSSAAGVSNLIGRRSHGRESGGGRSWQHPEPGRTQHHLARDEQHGRDQGNDEVLVIAHDFGEMAVGALEPIDLAQDADQRAIVAHAEILAVADGCDPPQDLFLVAGERRGAFHRRGAPRLVGRDRRRPARTDPNRVDPDAESARRFGRGEWVGISGVVAAVGQQHDHAALAREILEVTLAHGQGGADRGAIGQHADVGAVQQLEHDIRIGRQRGLCERTSREHHQSQKIAAAPRDKVAQYPLRYLDPVTGPEIEGFHAARDVEREHDVAAAHGRIVPQSIRPRASERHDDQREPQRAHHRWQAQPPHPARGRLAIEKRHPGKSEERRRRAGAAEPYPHRLGGHHDEERERPWVGELHPGERRYQRRYQRHYRVASQSDSTEWAVSTSVAGA